MKGLTLLFFIISILVTVYSKRDPPRNAAPTQQQADHEMKIWLKNHLFEFNFPAALDKLFIERLVVNVDGFELPPGNLWPYPSWVWNFKSTWLYNKIIDLIVSFKGMTRYTGTLFWYRITNSGLGIVGPNVNPNTYQKYYDLKSSLEKNNKRDTSEWRLASFRLSASLFHTAEDDNLMIDTLLEMCAETTLTPLKCDDPKAVDPWKTMIRNLIMSGYLRMGENDNCRENHSFESCLLPLQGKAIHRKTLGSTMAIKYMLIELEAVPANIGAKWLLNIAHMTLGTYPQNVPAKHLIEPSIFRSDYDIKTFPNVEELMDLDTFTSMGTGIFDDFDNDGLKDIFQCSQSYNRNVKYYKNLGNGKFQDMTESANLMGIDGGANCRQADFNNDGHLDLFIMRGGWLNLEHVNGLLRNNGDGTFTDISFYAGIFSQGATHSMDYADINKDGVLDMFVANEDLPCEMWLNNGNDTVRAVSNSEVLDCGLVKGMVFTDYNDDMWPDIFISRYGEKNRMLRNDGKWTDETETQWSFTDVTDKIGLGDPWFSFPCTSFDADQDGTLDILVAGHLFEGPDAVGWIYTNESHYLNQHHTPENPLFGSNPDQKLTRLFLNKNGKFEEIGAEGGLRRHIMSMASNYGDLDNDGNLDLYFGTGQPDIRALQPNKMYRNSGNGQYWQDVTSSGNFGHLQKGHGIAFADFDNDGDLDVYGQMGGAFIGDFFRDAIYLNPGHGNNYVKVYLQGVETNRNGLGSRIYVHTTTTHQDGVELSEPTTRIHHHYMNTGGSYGSNPLEAHIGLAHASRIDKIIVWWQKTNIKQEITNIKINTAIKIIENQKLHTEVELPTFTYDLTKLGEHNEDAPTCH